MQVYLKVGNNTYPIQLKNHYTVNIRIPAVEFAKNFFTNLGSITARCAYLTGRAVVIGSAVGIALAIVSLGTYLLASAAVKHFKQKNTPQIN